MADLERDLYEPVRRFVDRHFHCFSSGINVGNKLGRIDVVGIRDIGGDLSGRSEVIAVEVKRGTQPFATCAGQTLGYSIYADRCYLAEYRPSRPYSRDEMAVANRLGIGLLRIRSVTKIEEVLTAAVQQPLDRLRLSLCEKLGYSLCTICGSLFQRGDPPSTFNNVVRQERNTAAALRRAVDTQRGLVYWQYRGPATAAADHPDSDKTFRRRYLCPDCIASLFAHLADE